MIGKKINQLATELAPASTDLTIIGNPTTGVSKKITLAQLGAIFSGAVSFYTNYAALPTPGTTDVIYCAKDTQKLYLWSGSSYVEVFPSQALLDTYQLRSEKGNANGYASLDSTGKVPVSQLPSSIMEYKGTWSAATNTPTLANGTGDTGDVYICNAAGSVNFGAGAITFAVGDYVIYSGSIWQRSSGAVGTVTSVAASITGNAIGITGSPVTTSGTLAFAFAGTGAQYIKGDGTLATFPSTISQAEKLITEVYNSTGATLTKGTVVYINGGQGNLPTVTKALATGDSTSAQTFGIVQADITNNNNGYVVVAGKLNDLDTQAYTEGTQLYLSSTTAGAWTSTKQYAPAHLVYVGIVVRSHPTQGIVEVKIQNGYELDEIHNVAAQTPTNNDGLFWEASTSLWKNKSISTILGGTPITGSGSTNYIPKFTASGTIGNSNLYDNGTNIYNNNPSAGQFAWQINGNTTTGLSYGAVIVAGTNASDIALRIQNASSTSELFFVYGDGKVKINNIPNATTNTDAFLVSDGGFIKYRTGSQLLSDIGGQAALTNPVTGTGTTNYLSKFTGSTTIGNSLIQDNGTNVSINVGIFSGALLYLKGIGATTATYGLYVANSASTTTFYVNDAGNGYFASGVGIGTGPSSTYGLDVNGATRITGNLTATSFIKSGGTSSQYLMADGSVSTLTNPVTGTGTTNYLPKFTGASTIGNSIVSDSGGVVNVNGAFSTYGSITVNEDGAGTKVLTIRSNWAGVDPAINVTTNNSLLFMTNNTERMRLNTSGNLGLGVTPSAWASGWNVMQVGAVGNVSTYASSYIGINTYNAYYNGTSYIYQSTNGAAIYDYNGAVVGGFAWRLAPSGTAGNAISFTQAMTLNASGNLLLGTTTDPGYGRATASVYASDGGILRVAGSSTTALFYVYQPYNTAYLGTTSNHNLSLITNDAVRLTLASTGAATFSSDVTIGGLYTFSSWTTGTVNKIRGYFGNDDKSIQWNYNNSPAGTLIKDNNSFLLSINSTNTLFANSSGNVGIGTTSPANRLTVAGSSGTIMSLSNGADADLLMNFTSGVTLLTPTTGILAFGTSSTERMRITSGGLVGIGTTSPSAKLQVDDGAGAALYIGLSTNNYYRAYEHIWQGISGTTERMRIKSNGIINLSNVPSSSAGLSSGDIYKTVAGVLMIV